MKILQHLICIIAMHGYLLALAPDENLNGIDTCLNSYFSREPEHVHYAVWLDQLRQASRLSNDVQFCLTKAGERAIRVRENKVFLSLKALGEMQDNQTIIGLLVSAKALTQKLTAFKSIKINREYTLKDTLIVIGALMAHNADRPNPNAYDNTKGEPALDFTLFERTAYATPDRYLNSIFQESLTALKVSYRDTSKFKSYIKTYCIDQIYNCIDIKSNSILSLMNAFSETLVNQDSHIQERVLSIHEIVNSQKLQTYNEGLRSYLTVIHITGDKAYLAFLEKFLTSNAHGFLKKNALKNYFKRTPENKWSEHLFVYEFLTETPYVLSDDLHLWQSFSKFASNLGFTSDANVAQAIMLALLGDSLMAEQLMTGVISHPKQGKFQIKFILETHKRLLNSP